MSLKQVNGAMAAIVKAVYCALPAIYDEYIEAHKEDEPPCEDFMSLVCSKNNHAPYPAVRKTVRYVAWADYGMTETAIGAVFNCDRSTAYHTVSSIRAENKIYEDQKAFTREIKFLFEKHVKI